MSPLSRAFPLSRSVRLPAALLAAALLAGAAPPAAQAGPALEPVKRIEATGQDRFSARKLDLGIGKSVIIDLPTDAKEVFVANPAIANAVIRSTRKLFVIGVASGSTSIYITDADSRQIAAVEIAVGRDIGVLQRTLKLAIPTSEIVATSINDTSVILTGTVDTALDAQKAVDIANGFLGFTFVGPPAANSGGGQNSVSIQSSAGQVVTGNVYNSLTVRARDQVMLKVTVAEVKREALKQLGISFNGTWKIVGNDFNIHSVNPFALGAQQLSPSSDFSVGNNRLADLKAMEREGVFRTLAEPTLTAISGETAKFTAGGEVPVPGSATCASARSGNSECTQLQVQYKPYGVQLVFTPLVLSEGRISLRVATEVTDVDGDRTVVFGGINYPAFRVRRQDTTVELPSGGALVTAGLIQQTNRQVISGLPGLMNLPILGTLFRSRDYQREETELMMIVTPFIAKSNPVAALARPDDGFADSSDPQAVLMGRLNKIYGVTGSTRGAPAYRGQYGFSHD